MAQGATQRVVEDDATSVVPRLECGGRRGNVTRVREGYRPASQRLHGEEDGEDGSGQHVRCSTHHPFHTVPAGRALPRA